MYQIAYPERVLTDQTAIDRFLTEQRVGVLGLADHGHPYAVPVNYVWLDGLVYFHGLGSGRKNALLLDTPQVCFTVFAEHGTTTDPMPCHADTSYTSVMIFGSATPVTDLDQSATALQHLVDKLLPGFYRTQISSRLVDNYRSGMDDKPVAVYQILPDQLTAKQNLAAPSELYSHQA